MNIRTIFNLNTKINNLHKEITKQSLLEKIIQDVLFGGVLAIFLVFVLFIFSIVNKHGLVYSPLFLIIPCLSIYTIIKLTKLLHKNIPEKQKLLLAIIDLSAVKFKRREIVDKFANSFTEEEFKIFKQLVDFKNYNPNINVFENKILQLAEDADKKDIDFIIQSTDSADLKLNLLEIYKEKEDNKIELSKQKIVRSI